MLRQTKTFALSLIFSFPLFAAAQQAPETSKASGEHRWNVDNDNLSSYLKSPGISVVGQEEKGTRTPPYVPEDLDPAEEIYNIIKGNDKDGCPANQAQDEINTLIAIPGLASDEDMPAVLKDFFLHICSKRVGALFLKIQDQLPYEIKQDHQSSVWLVGSDGDEVKNVDIKDFLTQRYIKYRRDFYNMPQPEQNPMARHFTLTIQTYQQHTTSTTYWKLTSGSGTDLYVNQGDTVYLHLVNPPFSEITPARFSLNYNGKTISADVAGSGAVITFTADEAVKNAPFNGGTLTVEPREQQDQ